MGITFVENVTAGRRASKSAGGMKSRHAEPPSSAGQPPRARAAVAIASPPRRIGPLLALLGHDRRRRATFARTSARKPPARPSQAPEAPAVVFAGSRGAAEHEPPLPCARAMASLRGAVPA